MQDKLKNAQSGIEIGVGLLPNRGGAFMASMYNGTA